ncbi:penicillin acylase family protein [Brucella abortus]|nr:penicillin acylase family protein [Brucella abortus]
MAAQRGSSCRRNESADRWSTSLEELRPAIEGLMKLFPHDATGGGSNNWAVDARHSKTGMPIVAGDPHQAMKFRACTPRFT